MIITATTTITMVQLAVVVTSLPVPVSSGTGKPPWERITDHDLERTIASLNAKVSETDDGSIAERGCLFLREHLRTSSPTQT